MDKWSGPQHPVQRGLRPREGGIHGPDIIGRAEGSAGGRPPAGAPLRPPPAAGTADSPPRRAGRDLRRSYGSPQEGEAHEVSLEAAVPAV
jgi:hypothetical protein